METQFSSDINPLTLCVFLSVIISYLILSNIDITALIYIAYLYILGEGSQRGYNFSHKTHYKKIKKNTRM